jgi:VRR-NUC domain-containing protein
MAGLLTMKRRRPEQILQAAVCQHLQLRGAKGMFWWHHPAGGQRSRTEAAIFKGIGAKPGIPDLLFLKDSQLLCLELKAEGGRLSSAQVACHEALRAAGALVATAVGLDEALEVLEAWGLVRGTSWTRSPAVGFPTAMMTGIAQ